MKVRVLLSEFLLCSNKSLAIKKEILIHSLTDKKSNYSEVAQSVEQVTVNHWVIGSSPILGVLLINIILIAILSKMPITSSAKKAMRQSNKKRVVNKKFKDDMKIAINVFEKKVSKKQDIVINDLSVVYGRIDKALKKGIIHKNTAARRKSSIAKLYNAIEK